MTAAEAIAGTRAQPVMAAAIVLLIFIKFLLQADACAGILPGHDYAALTCRPAALTSSLPPETVVGRQSAASQKMLSVSAESLVFRIIYAPSRIGRCSRHDRNPFPRVRSRCCRS
jgi:hypothetical protein